MIGSDPETYAPQSVSVLEQVLKTGWWPHEVEAWPKGSLRVEVAAKIPAGFAHRDGVWRTPEEEALAHNFDGYEAEDYEDSYTYSYEETSTAEAAEPATSPVSWS